MNRKLILVAPIACLALFLALVARVPHSLAASVPQYQNQAQTITCSSDDMGRHTCEVDARGGAQLVRQISGSPCIFGRTWGYDSRGIWVDRGCRAEFQVGSVNWNGWDTGSSVYCASDDGNRHFCPVGTNNGVRLARQRSGSECVLGRTWGYTRRGIWVDQGCRADFDLGTYDNSAAQTQVISCKSDDMHWHICQANTGSGVQLLRQRSEADCIYGTTWGYDDRGIWVDRGCRGDFAIGGNQFSDESEQQSYAVSVYCSSDDMHRRFCYTGPHGAVRLAKKHSDSDCIEGRSWGQDPRGIWVDRGCRADFEVTVGGNANYGPDWNTGTITPLTCSSQDGKRHYCSADTRWGVRMARQRSGSPCTQDSTWGYDSNGIWVDRGCRADFEVLSPRR